MDVERFFATGAQTDLASECSRLDRTWKDVVVYNRQAVVRPVVMDSWNRCVRRGLDAAKAKSPRVLSSDQVDEYIQSDPVYAEALSALPALTTGAVDSRHLLVYCDAEGHIIHLAGDRSVRQRADNMNFVVGSHWGEDQAGTNAIGTAIVTANPVQLLGSEHYCQAVHDWTCSASPIRDPATGGVKAVIDMTGLRQSFHPHTLIAVMAVTQLVEERLRKTFETERYKLLEIYAEQTTRSQSPIAILDRGRRVVKASPLLLENGWIDAHGRLVDCTESTFAAGVETSWELERRNGRWSFMLIPILDAGRVLGAVVHVLRHTSGGARIPGALIEPARDCDPRSAFTEIVGNNPLFKRALSIARSSASTDVPVLIEGETGTGKELVAHAIHQESPRRNKPFVPVNCGALAKELAPSEFFGYDSGAFTGAAKEGRIGKFEQANGGTLFLDEIGDLPMDLQALFLRVLEDKTLVRLGGRKKIWVDVRVVAATNQDLRTATERGIFRRDLYYRLAVIKIQMPPLRHRKEDIEPLLNLSLHKAFGARGLAVPNVHKDVAHVLQEYAWPGNVRELRNLADWLSINSSSSAEIGLHDLPHEFLQPSSPETEDAKTTGHTANRLKDKELEIIKAALEECDHNVAEAARRLGINRTTIYRKLGRLSFTRSIREQ